MSRGEGSGGEGVDATLLSDTLRYINLAGKKKKEILFAHACADAQRYVFSLALALSIHNKQNLGGESSGGPPGTHGGVEGTAVSSS